LLHRLQQGLQISLRKKTMNPVDSAITTRKSQRERHPSKKAQDLSPQRTRLSSLKKASRKHQDGSSDAEWIGPISQSSRARYKFVSEAKSGAKTDEGNKKVMEVEGNDNLAAYEEYSAWIMGMEYRDKERARAVKALYSACVKHQWPVVCRFEGVRLDERWVEDREWKGKVKGGAFWREMEAVRREKGKEVREAVQSSEDSEEDPDLGLGEKEKGGKTQVNMKGIQATEEGNGKGEVGKGKKNLFVEYEHLSWEARQELIDGRQGKAGRVAIGAASSAKIYIMPTSNKFRKQNVEDGKERLRSMRNRETFVPMDRDKLAELVGPRLSLDTKEESGNLDGTLEEKTDIENHELPTLCSVAGKKRRQDEYLEKREIGEFVTVDGVRKKVRGILLKTGSALERERLWDSKPRRVPFSEEVKIHRDGQD
jgi:hypothetical protein